MRRLAENIEGDGGGSSTLSAERWVLRNGLAPSPKEGAYNFPNLRGDLKTVVGSPVGSGQNHNR